MVFGYIGDMLPSRRTPFLAGLVLVFLSTLCFALAKSLWILLAARLLEGLATAMVTVVGYALLTDVVEREHLGTAMGYTSMGLSLGLMIGPVIGGILYEYCGYFSVFLPVLCLIGIEIILRSMVVGKSSRPNSSPDSPERSQSKSPMHASADGDGSPNTSTESDALLAPKDQPEAPATSTYRVLLTSPRFLVALIGILLLNSMACGFDSILTPYLRDNFNMHAASAGALFLTLAIPMLLAPLFGKLTDRYGPKVVMTLGLVLLVPPLILLSLISHQTDLPIPKIAVVLAFLGLAFAIAMPPFRIEAILVVDALEEQKPGRFGPNGANSRTFGLVNLVTATGGLVGPLYSGFVRIAAGWKVLVWSNAGLSVVLLALVLLITAGKRRKNADAGEATV